MGEAQVRAFGDMDGVGIEEITIRSPAGAEAKIITWGAVVRDLVVPVDGRPQTTVLGLNSLADYRAHSPSFGAVPGRFANRIGRGQFTLDGKSYQLLLNEKGKTTLHGGPQGFGKRPWRLVASDTASVTLALTSPDGDAGFPGTLEATCRYELSGTTLRMELTATADAPTIVNLTNHSYFNLDGSADILDHELTVHAGFRTAVDEDLIPTGEIVTVAGTPFDFRSARTRPQPVGPDLRHELRSRSATRSCQRSRGGGGVSVPQERLDPCGPHEPVRCAGL